MNDLIYEEYKEKTKLYAQNKILLQDIGRIRNTLEEFRELDTPTFAIKQDTNYGMSTWMPLKPDLINLLLEYYEVEEENLIKENESL